jgi:hypothetical protein
MLLWTFSFRGSVSKLISSSSVKKVNCEYFD